jgi:hypothetical protein
MPYKFAEWDEEPEAQAGSQRTGGPPRKSTGIGLLDPPGPPSKHGSPFLSLPRFSNRILAALILAVLILALSVFVRSWFFPRP